MSRSKQKGTKYETEIVRLLLAAGFDCERTPASYNGDIAIRLPKRKLIGEAKRRARIKQLYDWLGTKDLLFMRRDALPGQKVDTLVVCRLDLFTELLKAVACGSLVAGGPPLRKVVGSEEPITSQIKLDRGTRNVL